MTNKMSTNEAMRIMRLNAPPPNAHEAVECLREAIDGLPCKTLEDLQRTFGIPSWSAYWLKYGVPEPEPDIFGDEPEQQKERTPEPLTVEPVSLPKEVHPAIAYLRVLFEEDDYIFFQLIHATRKHPLINKKTGLPRINSQTGESRMQADTELMPLVQIKVAATPEYMALLEAKQAEGWNIFVCMNPFPAGTKTRTESLVSVIRNLYLDVDKTKKNGDRALRLIDEAVASNSIEAPTSILESSDGNYHVDWRVSGFSWDEAKAMLSVLSNKLGGDPSAIDLNRVLRLPGFKNLKKERGGFICHLLQTPTSKEPYNKDLFKFPTVIEERKQIVKSSEAVQKRTDYIYANAEEADFDLGDESERTDGGVSWIVECPWAKGHTDGGDTAMIMVLGDGRPEFNCFHGHCNGLIGPKRGWSDIRELWETKVGHSQRFGDVQEGMVLTAGPTGLLPAGTHPAQVSDKLVEVAQLVKAAEDKAAEERLEGEAITKSLGIVQTPYPKFPEWAIRGTSLYEGFAKPYCDINQRHPEFMWMPAHALLLNVMGGRVHVRGTVWMPTFFMVCIGKRGEVIKSACVQDAIEYFRWMELANYFIPGTTRNAEGRSLVSTVGSPEGWGMDMASTGCKNGVLFYDELDSLVSKATIECSALRATLLTTYESGQWGNSTTNAKTKFCFAPGSYTATLIVCSTDQAFRIDWSRLSGKRSGNNDRFFFLLQPEHPKSRLIHTYVNTQEGSQQTRALLNKAFEKGVYDFTSESYKLLQQASERMSNRSEIRAEKLAFSLTVDLGQDLIDGEATERAIALIDYEIAVKRYLKLFDAETREGAIQAEIMSEIVKAGGWMTERDLKRKIKPQRFGTSLWNQSFTGLVKNGDIRVEGRGIKGQPTVIRLLQYDSAEEEL